MVIVTGMICNLILNGWNFLNYNYHQCYCHENFVLSLDSVKWEIPRGQPQLTYRWAQVILLIPLEIRRRQVLNNPTSAFFRGSCCPEWREVPMGRLNQARSSPSRLLIRCMMSSSLSKTLLWMHVFSISKMGRTELIGMRGGCWQKDSDQTEALLSL